MRQPPEEKKIPPRHAANARITEMAGLSAAATRLEGYMDSKAFFRLTCGLYIITSAHDGRSVGCVINTATQVTSSPKQIMIAVNKENFTASAILKTKAFGIMVLTEDVPMELIGTFGFHSSRDTDKFEGLDTATDSLGLPYLTPHCSARFSCCVQNAVDVGTHYLFIGLVEDSQCLEEKPAITYDYYHKVKKGLTPPKASSYMEPAADTPKETASWKCSICGYIYEGEELPADFVCPICGRGAEFFQRI